MSLFALFLLVAAVCVALQALAWLLESLPDDLKGQLFTVEDFEAELSRLRR